MQILCTVNFILRGVLLAQFEREFLFLSYDDWYKNLFHFFQAEGTMTTRKENDQEYNVIICVELKSQYRRDCRWGSLLLMCKSTVLDITSEGDTSWLC